jgi:peptide/nickel transport system permease protein
MWRYILRRVLYFIPTLVIITLLAFVISLQAPGDPVDRLLNTSQGTGEMLVESPVVAQQRRQLRTQMGLDLPVFYISVRPLSQPVSLPDHLNPDEQKAFRKLVNEYGQCKDVFAFYETLDRWYAAHRTITIPDGETRDQTLSALNYSTAAVRGLLQAGDPELAGARIDEMILLYKGDPALTGLESFGESSLQILRSAEANRSIWRNLIPAPRWHNSNQYHRWLFGDGNWLTGRGSVYTRGWIRGDMGTSYSSQLPVSEIIRSRIGWSLFFTLVSVLLAYLISIPIGLWSAARQGSLFDRGSSVVLFMLYSLPTFWVATLLLMNFANPDVFRWFPSSGVAPTEGIPGGTGFFERVRITLPYLVLPTICYTYSQLAFLSRLTRVSSLEVMAQDYIRTAKAKGLPESKVLVSHTLRNTLLPLITVMATVFPAAVGGSVILETVFTIPGMGREIIEAIYQKDYPLIVSVFTLTGILTLLGYLLADILYAISDPRIEWKR